jgi:hypothetical protein
MNASAHNSHYSSFMTSHSAPYNLASDTATYKSINLPISGATRIFVHQPLTNYRNYYVNTHIYVPRFTENQSRYRVIFISPSLPLFVCSFPIFLSFFQKPATAHENISLVPCWQTSRAASSKLFTLCPRDHRCQFPKSLMPTHKCVSQ